MTKSAWVDTFLTNALLRSTLRPWLQQHVQGADELGGQLEQGGDGDGWVEQALAWKIVHHWFISLITALNAGLTRTSVPGRGVCI